MMKRFTIIISAVYILTNNLNANITIPEAFRDCAEQINSSLINCSNPEIWQRAIYALNTTLMCIPKSENIQVPEYIVNTCEYGATASWLYLATRSLVKYFIPEITQMEELQSGFQQFLSHDITSFFMTLPTAIVFGALAGWTVPLLLECFIDGIPLVIGSLQGVFDIVKMVIGGIKKWCNTPNWLMVLENKEKDRIRKITETQMIKIKQLQRSTDPDLFQSFLEEFDKKEYENLNWKTRAWRRLTHKPAKYEIKINDDNWEQILTAAYDYQNGESNALVALISRRTDELKSQLEKSRGFLLQGLGQVLGVIQFQINQWNEIASHMMRLTKTTGNVVNISDVYDTSQNLIISKEDLSAALKKMLKEAINEYNMG